MFLPKIHNHYNRGSKCEKPLLKSISKQINACNEKETRKNAADKQSLFVEINILMQ